MASGGSQAAVPSKERGCACDFKAASALRDCYDPKISKDDAETIDNPPRSKRTFDSEVTLYPIGGTAAAHAAAELGRAKAEAAAAPSDDGGRKKGGPPESGDGGSGSTGSTMAAGSSSASSPVSTSSESRSRPAKPDDGADGPRSTSGSAASKPPSPEKPPPVEMVDRARREHFGLDRHGRPSNVRSNTDKTAAADCLAAGGAAAVGGINIFSATCRGCVVKDDTEEMLEIIDHPVHRRGLMENEAELTYHFGDEGFVEWPPQAEQPSKTLWPPPPLAPQAPYALPRIKKAGSRSAADTSTIAPSEEAGSSAKMMMREVDEVMASVAGNAKELEEVMASVPAAQPFMQQPGPGRFRGSEESPAPGAGARRGSSSQASSQGRKSSASPPPPPGGGPGLREADLQMQDRQQVAQLPRSVQQAGSAAGAGTGGRLSTLSSGGESNNGAKAKSAGFPDSSLGFLSRGYSSLSNTEREWRLRQLEMSLLEEISEIEKAGSGLQAPKKKKSVSKKTR